MIHLYLCRYRTLSVALHVFIMFQGRRGWSRGPLVTVPEEANRKEYSWPSPCGKGVVNMHVNYTKKKQLTIREFGNPGSNGTTLSKNLI